MGDKGPGSKGGGKKPKTAVKKRSDDGSGRTEEVMEGGPGARRSTKKRPRAGDRARPSHGRTCQPMQRPSAADLRGRRPPDDPRRDRAPAWTILFVGINPGLWSGATGRHFARPGNRFWKAIHLAGLTSRLLSPDRQADLLAYGWESPIWFRGRRRRRPS